MTVTLTSFPGLVVIEPKVFGDDRGYFFESYSKPVFDSEVCPVDFVQDNQSLSSRGVLRGLHFQKPPFAQAKLVRCVAGAILDFAVDLRVGSPSYGIAFRIELSDDNFRQLFIPRGFAHGFAVLSSQAIVQYKCDETYHPEAEGGILITDPNLTLDLPDNQDDYIMSRRDLAHPCLADFSSPFVYE